jgi:predicted metal-dependent phosphoesterase TrpH
VTFDRDRPKTTVYEVELHAHSDRSHDGRDTVEDLLDRARAVGLDALAVTDHDSFEASERAAALAPEYDLFGIRGIEVTSAAGHVLGLGVDRPIEPGLSFGETLGRIHDAGGVAVIPHPYQELRQGVLGAIPQADIVAADAIEVYNSRLLTGRANQQARRLAARYDMPITAGSDAHVSEMVGRAVTLVDADELTAGAILDAIQDGRTEIRGQRTPIRVTLRQAAGGVRRRVSRQLDRG